MSEFLSVTDLFSSNAKIGLISKDAGSSNLIAHAFADYPNTLVYCEEPGKTIFLSLGFPLASCANDVFNFSNNLIIGTGGSDFEKAHLQMALQTDSTTYSVLDHWIHYESRFEFGEARINPNKLLVFDEDARDLAQLKFPHTSVFCLANKYQEAIQSQVRSFSKKTSTFTFLYIHENFTHKFEGKEYWKACFERFYSKVCRLHSKFLIRLRIHPKDNPKDFIQFVSELSGVVLSNSDLAIDIAQSDIIVGIRSAALEVARSCGKPVYTLNICSNFALPGPISRLPEFQDAYVL